MRRFVLMALMITVLGGCGTMKNEDYNSYQRMYKMYNNMTSYSAEADVIINSNNTQNKYSVKQFYLSPGMTRSETISPPDAAGVITVVNGQRAAITAPKTKSPTIIENLKDNEMNYLFVSSFFETYLKSEKTTLAVSGGNNQKAITLRAETGLLNPYRKAVTLKADERTLKPISLEICGEDGKVYAAVHFKTFTLNTQLDQALFKLPN